MANLLSLMHLFKFIFESSHSRYSLNNILRDLWLLRCAQQIYVPTRLHPTLKSLKSSNANRISSSASRMISPTKRACVIAIIIKWMKKRVCSVSLCNRRVLFIAINVSGSGEEEKRTFLRGNGTSSYNLTWKSINFPSSTS